MFSKTLNNEYMVFVILICSFIGGSKTIVFFIVSPEIALNVDPVAFCSK